MFDRKGAEVGDGSVGSGVESGEGERTGVGDIVDGGDSGVEAAVRGIIFATTRGIAPDEKRNIVENFIFLLLIKSLEITSSGSRGSEISARGGKITR